MNRKVAGIVGIGILLMSILAGYYYLGWKIPYLPSQNTLSLLYEEVVEVYKGYNIIAHAGITTYWYAQAITDPSIISPQFNVPGDATASINLVKAWIDANPPPTPPDPPVPPTTIVWMVGFGVVAGIGFLLYSIFGGRFVGGTVKRVSKKRRKR